MKFAYIDESGKEEDGVSVMAGVIIDAYRVHSARREWLEMLKDMEPLAGRPIPEFHMKDVYRGEKEWRGVHYTKRAEAIYKVLTWLKERRHRVVFSATYKPAFEARATSGCSMLADLQDRWVTQAFHVTLAINKEYRKESHNKGKTLLILDRDGGYERRLAELIVDPPSWSDSYYDKANEEALSAIIDTAVFADSLHAPLIQLADAIAFILRRLSTIRDAEGDEKFSGEREVFEGWVELIKPRFQASRYRYPKIGRCPCAQLFWDVAPPSLRSL